ncbi:MAG TPA: cytochrome c biogenesis protein ResB [Desulfobacterales bacterium]
MSTTDSTSNFLDQVWKFFTSIRLTVVLLLTLAITSIVGTLIPQNESPEAYRQAFGDLLYRFFQVLDLFDMYRSWWFQLLLLMLTVNVVVCSLDRFSATWKIVTRRNPGCNPARFRSSKNKIELTDPRPSAELRPEAESLVKKQFGNHVTEATDGGFVLCGEKWRWSRLGVYIVHSSVVLLLIGGLIGSLFGFEGYVNIAEGESVNQIRLRNRNAAVTLDFAIRCDDFDVSFYESGMPKEYRSRLTILEQGEPVLQKDIVVNQPLRYRGINIFQSSYGELPGASAAPPENFTLSFTSKETGMIYSRKASIGQKITLPEELGELEIKGFVPAYDFRGTDLGATLVGTLIQPDGGEAEIVLPLRFPSFDKMSPMFNPNRSDAVFITVESIEERQDNTGKRYFTGLQVTRDPGVPVVYAGFILMILGFIVTFFMSHQRVCIEVTRQGGSSRVMIAGIANKNKLGMQRKVNRLGERLCGVSAQERESES